ncbi:MAG: hypothetical protein PUA95_01160 [Lactimicrobium massiliense]|nr:hypothetical protein [Lactimicrobium massiliense]MDD6229323.1 hypothetical protein [Lactimicrobium massiliense]MDD6458032.1 hypothetical protein [Lactimicrobium massiliense]MDD6560559.1 hypothetical protein [Lactimicrobium massiliense]MDY3930946.1 hypothetical protein [Erysipelotrichaceae bacterium]
MAVWKKMKNKAVRICIISALIVTGVFIVKHFLFDSWISYIKPESNIPATGFPQYRIHLARFAPKQIRLIQYSFEDGKWIEKKTVSFAAAKNEFTLVLYSDEEGHTLFVDQDGERAASFGQVDNTGPRMISMIINTRHLKTGKEQNIYAVGHSDDLSRMGNDPKKISVTNVDSGTILSMTIANEE